MSTKKQQVSGYTRKNGTVVSGYSRNTSVQHNIQSTSSNFQSGGKLSKLERDFANKKENFSNESTYEKIQKKIKLGDDAHKNGNYELEGTSHRQVQEEIRRNGGVGKYDKEGKMAYAWNSLFIHYEPLISTMNKDGFSFNDTFYFDHQTDRYYLTQKARDHADLCGYTYDDYGSTSLVKPANNSFYSQRGGNEIQNSDTYSKLENNSLSVQQCSDQYYPHHASPHETHENNNQNESCVYHPHKQLYFYSEPNDPVHTFILLNSLQNNIEQQFIILSPYHDIGYSNYLCL